MRIYIASSWKNQHAVELLTQKLREAGHEVLSFVENNFAEKQTPEFTDFETWVQTPAADRCFQYDTQGATRSDLVIYIAPSGIDAGAEVGAAWAAKIPVLGLYAKGDAFGLMRKMVKWVPSFRDILREVEIYKKMKEGVR
jgi:hypothetical protein